MSYQPHIIHGSYLIRRASPSGRDFPKKEETGWQLDRTVVGVCRGGEGERERAGGEWEVEGGRERIWGQCREWGRSEVGRETRSSGFVQGGTRGRER